MALRNVRVIELAGLAPAPFCGMILSDFGADVVRIDRIGGDPLKSLLNRGKKCLQLDLKRAEGIKVIEKLCTQADVIIEPYRPGVMEKMGLGPEKLMQSNNRLIYARLSGFGQQGPLSQRAGHDINYLSVSGLLSLFKAFGKNSLPNPPINILADFAAGGLSCALGITMALIERNTSGLGQVVDANMTEGCSYLASYIRESRNNPLFKQFMWPNPEKPGENLLDGGAPFYSVYKTLDDKYMAVGALEPQFFALFIEKVGLEGDYYPGIIDQSMREKLTKIFESKTQKEWIDVFDGTDACVTPVVDFDNAAEFDHNKTNKSFLANGMPVPAPRLTRTTANPVLVERQIEDIFEFLQEYGFEKNQIHELLENKVVDLPKLTHSKL